MTTSKFVVFVVLSAAPRLSLVLPMGLSLPVAFQVRFSAKESWPSGVFTTNSLCSEPVIGSTQLPTPVLTPSRLLRETLTAFLNNIFCCNVKFSRYMGRSFR